MKSVKIITKPFQIIVKDSNLKPNKIWVDESTECYSSTNKPWL